MFNAALESQTVAIRYGNAEIHRWRGRDIHSDLVLPRTTSAPKHADVIAVQPVPHADLSPKPPQCGIPDQMGCTAYTPMALFLHLLRSLDVCELQNIVVLGSICHP